MRCKSNVKVCVAPHSKMIFMKKFGNRFSFDQKNGTFSAATPISKQLFILPYKPRLHKDFIHTDFNRVKRSNINRMDMKYFSPDPATSLPPLKQSLPTSVRPLPSLMRPLPEQRISFPSSVHSLPSTMYSLPTRHRSLPFQPNQLIHI